MLSDLQRNLDTINKIYDGKVEAKGKIEFADFFGGGSGDNYGGVGSYSGSGGTNSDSAAFLPTVVPEKSRLYTFISNMYIVFSLLLSLYLSLFQGDTFFFALFYDNSKA